jgi:AraC-like DNA-binding protein
MDTLKTVLGSNYFQSPQFPLAATFCEREGSPEHRHDFVEIVLVARGSGKHLHRDPRGKAITYDLVENDVFVVPIGWSHGYLASKNLSIYNVIYSPPLIANDFINASNSANTFALFSGQPQRLSSSGLVYKIHLRHAARLAAESVIKEIKREIVTRRHGYEMLAKAKLLEFFSILERAEDDRPATGQSHQSHQSHQSIAMAIRYVEDNYQHPVGLQDIADAVGLHPTHLCKRFAQVAGIPPGKYLTRLRIEHAKGLLLTTDFSITQIAQRSGFCDSSYFTRVFRAHIGRTPKDFRRTLQFA